MLFGYWLLGLVIFLLIERPVLRQEFPLRLVSRSKIVVTNVKFFNIQHLVCRRFEHMAFLNLAILSSGTWLWWLAVLGFKHMASSPAWAFHQQCLSKNLFAKPSRRLFRASRTWNIPNPLSLLHKMAR